MAHSEIVFWVQYTLIKALEPAYTAYGEHSANPLALLYVRIALPCGLYAAFALACILFAEALHDREQWLGAGWGGAAGGLVPPSSQGDGGARPVNMHT